MKKEQYILKKLCSKLLYLTVIIITAIPNPGRVSVVSSGLWLITFYCVNQFSIDE